MEGASVVGTGSLIRSGISDHCFCPCGDLDANAVAFFKTLNQKESDGRSQQSHLCLLPRQYWSPPFLLSKQTVTALCKMTRIRRSPLRSYPFSAHYFLTCNRPANPFAFFLSAHFSAHAPSPCGCSQTYQDSKRQGRRSVRRQCFFEAMLEAFSASQPCLLLKMCFLPKLTTTLVLTEPGG